MDKPVLVLMTGALRLADNAALSAAISSGRPVVPVFILDEFSPKVRPLGAASKWWLMTSLKRLAGDIERLGNRFIIRQGQTLEVMQDLISEVGADTIHLMRGYTPGNRAIEASLHETLTPMGVNVKRFGGNLLCEPEHIFSKTGSPYTVFSPFWRRLQELVDDTVPLPVPEKLRAPESFPASEAIADLDLDPKPAHWAEPIAAAWKPGEAAASELLETFLSTSTGDYKKARDFPGTDGTSFLSPYLAFGEISPRIIWHEAKKHIKSMPEVSDGTVGFLREVGWRDFCAHLLFHQPQLQHEPLREQFRTFPWKKGNGAQLAAWQKGLTGFPIVDAGMRQLWQTGWMHNRVRMIVASFLVKDLLWHWKDGEAWFWDTLVDADFASNIANWQWVAGCGADAAPYFRIFNPVTQGEKFDPDGVYVRQFVPELANLPDAYIHKPFEAPEGVLQMAGVALGSSYPEPIVDRKISRERALAALASIKKAD